MSKTNTLETNFLRAVAGGYDPDSEFAYAIKANWKRVSKSYFEKLGRDANFDKCNVWYSAGGPACSGDINLQGVYLDGPGIHLFMNIDGCAGLAGCATIRTIKDLGDYTGGTNVWLSDLSSEHILKAIRQLTGKEVA